MTLCLSQGMIISESELDFQFRQPCPCPDRREYGEEVYVTSSVYEIRYGKVFVVPVWIIILQLK